MNIIALIESIAQNVNPNNIQQFIQLIEGLIALIEKIENNQQQPKQNGSAGS